MGFQVRQWSSTLFQQFYVEDNSRQQWALRGQEPELFGNSRHSLKEADQGAGESWKRLKMSRADGRPSSKHITRNDILCVCVCLWLVCGRQTTPTTHLKSPWLLVDKRERAFSSAYNHLSSWEKVKPDDICFCFTDWDARESFSGLSSVIQHDGHQVLLSRTGITFTLEIFYYATDTKFVLCSSLFKLESRNWTSGPDVGYALRIIFWVIFIHLRSDRNRSCNSLLQRLHNPSRRLWPAMTNSIFYIQPKDEPPKRKERAHHLTQQLESRVTIKGMTNLYTLRFARP